MADGNVSLVEKLPNWLRWVLIPFGVIISFFLASFAIRFFSWIQGMYIGAGEDSWFGWLQYYVLLPAASNYIAIIVGCYIAPNYKFITSLIIGAMFIMLSGIGIFMYLAVEFDFAMFVAMIAAAVGAAAAIYQTNEDKKTNL